MNFKCFIFKRHHISGLLRPSPGHRSTWWKKWQSNHSVLSTESSGSVDHWFGEQCAITQETMWLFQQGFTRQMSCVQLRSKLCYAVLYVQNQYRELDRTHPSHASSFKRLSHAFRKSIIIFNFASAKRISTRAVLRDLTSGSTAAASWSSSNSSQSVVVY